MLTKDNSGMATEIPPTELLYIRRGFLIGLGLVIVTLAVYWQVLNHDFVDFDDDIYVTENPHVQKGLTIEGIKWAFTTTHAANWHPLTWLSHMLDCEIFGLNPSGHHLTNLLLHLGNTLLLFFILEQMTGTLWRSAFVAALFALHPLHVESVAWVAERKDVLVTFGGMLSLLAYQRYVQQHRLISYLLILIFLSLGLMAKPMLATFPFLFLLLDFWPLKRFQWCTDRLCKGEKGTALAVRNSLQLIREKVPLLVPVVISSIITFKAQLSSGAVSSLDAFSLKVRVANAFVSYASYVVKAIWPVHLGVFYPHPGDLLPCWQAVGSAVLVAAACFGAIRVSTRYPYVLVGLFWYFGTLIPVIGLVQVGEQAMADRYTYIPLIGLFIIVAWGVPKLSSGLARRKKWLAAAATVLISILMVLTWQQVQYWKNSITLFEHSIKVTSNNYKLHYNLGVALVKEGRIDEAVGHYSEALRIQPDSLNAHYNLGNVLARQGRIDEAIAHYLKVLRINPDYAAAHTNLGIALIGKKKFERTIYHFQEALRITPDDINAKNNLKNALGDR